jgi:hypothetical protein
MYHNKIDFIDLKNGVFTSFMAFCYHALQPLIYIYVISGDSLTSANANTDPIIETITNSGDNITTSFVIAIMTLVIGVVGSFLLRHILADPESLFTIILKMLANKMKFKKLGNKIKKWAEKDNNDFNSTDS